MGLFSARMAGDVTVALLENDVEIQECSISLINDNFDIPFEVTEGCVINFVSKSNRSDTLCTNVSLVMKIIRFYRYKK